MKFKLKSMLRNWLFSDYKWITRSQVQSDIGGLLRKYNQYPLVIRVLNELKETIK